RPARSVAAPHRSRSVGRPHLTTGQLPRCTALRRTGNEEAASRVQPSVDARDAKRHADGCERSSSDDDRLRKNEKTDFLQVGQTIPPPSEVNQPGNSQVRAESYGAGTLDPHFIRPLSSPILQSIRRPRSR